MLLHESTPEQAIVAVDSPNLELIPAHIDLVAIEIELVDTPNRETMLQSALSSIEGKYDYILIDCAPSLGLITLNALTAAHTVIIPYSVNILRLRDWANYSIPLKASKNPQ